MLNFSLGEKINGKNSICMSTCSLRFVLLKLAADECFRLAGRFIQASSVPENCITVSFPKQFFLVLFPVLLWTISFKVFYFLNLLLRETDGLSFARDFLRFQLFHDIRCVAVLHAARYCLHRVRLGPKISRHLYHLIEILLKFFTRFVNDHLTNWLEWFHYKAVGDAFVVHISKTSEIV